MAALSFQGVVVSNRSIAAAWRLLHARMSGWLYVSLLLAVAIVAIAPHQLPVTLYKLSLIATAGWLGYWLDRALFPYARPHDLIRWGESLDTPDVPLMISKQQAVAFAAAMLRRALIIAAVVIGVGLGA
ncbi:putative holin [Thauera sinica]|uniref:Holin n=1 Tax=Thauera sinica TaxID=2665146 RepID=A0ABW1ARA9_9RHOO|nr:putative holin [Thauera sp. K11]ATE60149.1 hypothetical protein CCZ27_09495 [Thauera sp. K11]